MAAPATDDPVANFALLPLHSLYLGKKRLRRYMSDHSSNQQSLRRTAVGFNTINAMPTMTTCSAINTVMTHLELAPFSEEEFSMGIQRSLQMSMMRPPNSGGMTDIEEAFEERAAIMEYMGGMTREEAERMAAEDIKQQEAKQ